MNALTRAPVDISHLEIRLLQESDSEFFNAFSCGDDDLDNFLRNNAIRLQQSQIARTHIAFYQGDFIGYITLLTDCVELKRQERKRLSLSYSDHPIVPALKIARLAVSANARSRFRNIGTALIQFACATALELSHFVGCRLITVDAYPESVGFYERLGFVRNDAKSYEQGKHPSMRFDLFSPHPPRWLRPSDDQKA